MFWFRKWKHPKDTLSIFLEPKHEICFNFWPFNQNPDTIDMEFASKEVNNYDKRDAFSMVVIETDCAIVFYAWMITNLS